MTWLFFFRDISNTSQRSSSSRRRHGSRFNHDSSFNSNSSRLDDSSSSNGNSSSTFNSSNSSRFESAAAATGTAAARGTTAPEKAGRGAASDVRNVKTRVSFNASHRKTREGPHCADSGSRSTAFSSMFMKAEHKTERRSRRPSHYSSVLPPSVTCMRKIKQQQQGLIRQQEQQQQQGLLNDKESSTRSSRQLQLQQQLHMKIHQGSRTLLQQIQSLLLQQWLGRQAKGLWGVHLAAPSSHMTSWICLRESSYLCCMRCCCVQRPSLRGVQSRTLYSHSFYLSQTTAMSLLSSQKGFHSAGSPASALITACFTSSGKKKELSLPKCMHAVTTRRIFRRERVSTSSSLWSSSYAVPCSGRISSTTSTEPTAWYQGSNNRISDHSCFRVAMRVSRAASHPTAAGADTAVAGSAVATGAANGAVTPTAAVAPPGSFQLSDDDISEDEEIVGPSISPAAAGREGIGVSQRRIEEGEVKGTTRKAFGRRRKVLKETLGETYRDGRGEEEEEGKTRKDTQAKGIKDERKEKDGAAKEDYFDCNHTHTSAGGRQIEKETKEEKIKHLQTLCWDHAVNAEHSAAAAAPAESTFAAIGRVALAAGSSPAAAVVYGAAAAAAGSVASVDGQFAVPSRTDALATGSALTARVSTCQTLAVSAAAEPGSAMKEKAGAAAYAHQQRFTSSDASHEVYAQVIQSTGKQAAAFIALQHQEAQQACSSNQSAAAVSACRTAGALVTDTYPDGNAMHQRSVHPCVRDTCDAVESGALAAVTGEGLYVSVGHGRRSVKSNEDTVSTYRRDDRNKSNKSGRRNSSAWRSSSTRRRNSSSSGRSSRSRRLRNSSSKTCSSIIDASSQYTCGDQYTEVGGRSNTYNLVVDQESQQSHADSSMTTSTEDKDNLWKKGSSSNKKSRSTGSSGAISSTDSSSKRSSVDGNSKKSGTDSSSACNTCVKDVSNARSSDTDTCINSHESQGCENTSHGYISSEFLMCRKTDGSTATDKVDRTMLLSGNRKEYFSRICDRSAGRGDPTLSYLDMSSSSSGSSFLRDSRGGFASPVYRALTCEMQQLEAVLLPQKERERALRNFLEQLQELLSSNIEACVVAAFGSAVNGLWTPYSDVDVCVQLSGAATRPLQIKALRQIAQALQPVHTYCIETRFQARVPIIHWAPRCRRHHNCEKMSKAITQQQRQLLEQQQHNQWRECLQQAARRYEKMHKQQQLEHQASKDVCEIQQPQELQLQHAENHEIRGTQSVVQAPELARTPSSKACHNRAAKEEYTSDSFCNYPAMPSLTSLKDESTDKIASSSTMDEQSKPQTGRQHRHAARNNSLSFSDVGGGNIRDGQQHDEECTRMIACDISVNNLLAVVNSKLLEAYVNVDPRLRTLGYAVKWWAHGRHINDRSRGTFSSFSLILMLIHFLQRHTFPPILPSLQDLAIIHRLAPVYIAGVDCRYTADRELIEEELAYLRGGKHIPPNRQSAGELLVQFFHYFGYEYRGGVIDIRDTSSFLGRANDYSLSERGAENFAAAAYLLGTKKTAWNRVTAGPADAAIAGSPSSRETGGGFTASKRLMSRDRFYTDLYTAEGNGTRSGDARGIMSGKGTTHLEDIETFNQAPVDNDFLVIDNPFEIGKDVCNLLPCQHQRIRHEFKRAYSMLSEGVSLQQVAAPNFR